MVCHFVKIYLGWWQWAYRNNREISSYLCVIGRGMAFVSDIYLYRRHLARREIEKSARGNHNVSAFGNFERLLSNYICRFSLLGRLYRGFSSAGLLNNRISHGGYLLMREASIDDSRDDSRTRQDRSPFLPEDLPMPVSLLLGAMLIVGGARVCWYAWDIAETGCHSGAFAIILAGWILLDGGLLLILVTLGVW